MSLETPLPERRCPLCGGPNACVPALCGGFDQPCWCERVSFPEALLARVPEAARGNACVCAACANAHAAATAGMATTAMETVPCR